ncbi:reverse transcriptase [Trichonephila clavipes]|nr:reverse transcriptase [Trichonephila clavipes]
MAAIREATTQLLAAGLAPAKAAILALRNDTPIDCLNTIQRRTKIAKLISYSWTVALQWVPSHVGILDNERADQKARQATESSKPEVPLRTKSIIPT